MHIKGKTYASSIRVLIHTNEESQLTKLANIQNDDKYFMVLYNIIYMPIEMR